MKAYSFIYEHYRLMSNPEGVHDHNQWLKRHKSQPVSIHIKLDFCLICKNIM